MSTNLKSLKGKVNVDMSITDREITLTRFASGAQRGVSLQLTVGLSLSIQLDNANVELLYEQLKEHFDFEEKEKFVHKDLEFDRERLEKMGDSTIVYGGFKSAPISRFILYVGDMTYYYDTEGGRDADYRLLQKLKPNFKFHRKD